LGVWEFPGSGPTVLFAHATGFHARCWDQIVCRLPVAWRVIAVDLRGHGRSFQAVRRPTRWKQFGEDVAAIAQTLGLRDAIGVGHSMGGHSVLHSVTLRPETYGSLLLLDPVVMPPRFYGTPLMNDHYTRKRRNQWSSGEEMFERYQSRAPFSTWDRETLHDYCRYALREGTTVLACDPDFEASIYEACSDAESNLHPDLPKISCPALVIRSKFDMGEGEFDMNWSPCDPGLAGLLPKGRDYQAGTGHFIPMEDPGLVADAILQLGE
jgi:lipase